MQVDLELVHAVSPGPPVAKLNPVPRGHTAAKQETEVFFGSDCMNLLRLYRSHILCGAEQTSVMLHATN